MLKVGVIGGGSISEFHIKPYVKNDRVQLSLYVITMNRRLAEVGARYGVAELYTNYEELLRMRRLMQLVFVLGIIRMRKLPLLHWKQENMYWSRNH